MVRHCVLRESVLQYISGVFSNLVKGRTKKGQLNLPLLRR